jgi:ABC-type transport system involved in multi-copper enzyme maturation permease subunit
MYDQILAVAKTEWRCQVKSWVFWIGLLIIIGVPLVVDFPSSAADILTPKSAGICYSIGIVMMGSLFMPLLTAVIFYKDRVTSMPVMIFSQPVSKATFVLGKFFGMFSVYLTIVLLGILPWISIPIFFGEMPYSPIVFIQYLLIYSLPSMFYFASLCYLVEIGFHKIIATLFIPLIFVIFYHMLPVFASHILPDYITGTIAAGLSLQPDMLQILIINRLFLIIAGIGLLYISTRAFSLKKFMGV